MTRCQSFQRIVGCFFNFFRLLTTIVSFIVLFDVLNDDKLFHVVERFDVNVLHDFVVTKFPELTCQIGNLRLKIILQVDRVNLEKTRFKKDLCKIKCKKKMGRFFDFSEIGFVCVMNFFSSQFNLT
jgi:hypothetical protein